MRPDGAARAMTSDENDQPEPSDPAEEKRDTLDEPRVEDEGGDEQTDPVPDA